MSNSSSPDHSCAVHSDGTLKDALEIDWDYNPDEKIPVPADFAVAASPTGTNSPPKIHLFSAGQAPAAIKVVGAHCSIGTCHLSAHAVDLNNTMSATGALLGMQSSTAPVE
jgi:hypothetical protein